MRSRVVGVGAVEVLVRARRDADRPRRADIRDLRLEMCRRCRTPGCACSRDRPRTRCPSRPWRSRAAVSNWPGSVASRAPRLENSPVLVELRDARVAVAVRDEDVARAIPRDIGRPIEVVAGNAGARYPPPPPVRRRAAAPASRRIRPTSGLRPIVISDPAVGLELDHHVGAAVHHPDVVLRIHPHRLREQESVHALADLAHVLARPIELEQPRAAVRERARAADRGVAAAGPRVDEDVALGVGGHAGGFADVHVSGSFSRVGRRVERDLAACLRRSAPATSSAAAARMSSSWRPHCLRLRRCGCRMIFCTRHARDLRDQQLVLVAAIDLVHRAEFASCLARLAELAEDGAVQFHLVDLAGHRRDLANCCCPGFELELYRYWCGPGVMHTAHGAPTWS